MKELEVAYLYADGHLVQVWRDRAKGIEIKYATITEKYVEHGPKGRLVVHWSALPLLDTMKGGKVEAGLPSLDRGSERSKELGIPVGHVSWHDKKGRWTSVTLLDCISGGFTYQPDAQETYEETKEMTRWADYPISR